MTDEATDILLPDPRATEPSPVAGLTRAEYENIARNILAFGRLPLSQQLRAIAQDIAWVQRSRSLISSAGDEA